MAQRLFDLIDGERSHLDGLGEQHVSSVSLQFEYLDMPPEPGTVGRAYRYLQVVSPNCSTTFGMLAIVMRYLTVAISNTSMPPGLRCRYAQPKKLCHAERLSR